MLRKYMLILFSMLPLGAVVGLIIAAAVTSLMPRIYESQAIIEVRRPPAPSFPQNNDNFSHAIAKEMAEMKNNDALMQVVANLDLPGRWAIDSDAARQVVANSLTMTQIRDSDLVSIHARHTNKQDARDIAMELANTYQRHRAQTDGKVSKELLQSLESATQKQEAIVEEKRKILADLVSHDHPLAQSNESRNKSMEAYVEAKRNFETEQALYQEMKLKLIGENIAAKIPYESVRFHEFPQEAHTPLSPNVTFNLIFGTALGLLASFPLSLLILWLRSPSEVAT